MLWLKGAGLSPKYKVALADRQNQLVPSEHKCSHTQATQAWPFMQAHFRAKKVKNVHDSKRPDLRLPLLRFQTLTLTAVRMAYLHGATLN